jgi:hypothetical protein
MKVVGHPSRRIPEYQDSVSSLGAICRIERKCRVTRGRNLALRDNLLLLSRRIGYKEQSIDLDDLYT